MILPLVIIDYSIPSFERKSMGMCPVPVGINVPNIHRFLSSYFIEQVKRKNAPKKGMRQRSLNTVNRQAKKLQSS